MKIKLNRPISYGEGKQSTEYDRGLYQTDDPKAKGYIPSKLAQEFLTLADQHSGAPIAEEYIAREAATPPIGVARVSQKH